MLNLSLILVWHIFCLLRVKTEDYCLANYVLGDFPDQIKNDMFMAATTGDVLGFQGCPDKVKIDSERIGLWYNNKVNPDQPIRLEHKVVKQIDSKKPLVFLIHGWLCNVTSNLMPELKDAYLKRYGDINVIRVEWNTYATVNYFNSYCYIPKIAELLGTFLCHLNSTLNVNLDEAHIVAHSMGAQIAGLTGKEVQKQCNQKIGRITGLDPAGPIYKRASETERLHKMDAKIVDVIHTNQNQAGFFGSCGSVDFYPNCGFFQPNSMIITNSTKLEDIRHLSLDIILRSHILAVEYFLESILFESFKATSCVDCETPRCVEDTEFIEETTMGEHYPKHLGSKTNYAVMTNGYKPYGRKFIPTHL